MHRMSGRHSRQEDPGIAGIATLKPLVHHSDSATTMWPNASETRARVAGLFTRVNPSESVGEANSTTRIVRAIVALTAGAIVARLIAFLATALLARRLGPASFGIVGFATALSGYLALVVNSGLGEVGSREVARAPEAAADVYWRVSSVRLLLAAIASAALLVVAVSIPKPAATQLVVALSGLSFLSIAVDPTWALKGLERPVLAGVGQVVAQSLYVVGVWLLVSGPAEVARVPIVLFVGEAVAAFILVGVLLGSRRPRFALAEGLRLLRETRYLTLARLLRVVVISADVVMLGFLATDRDVGVYTAAYRVAFLLMAVSGAVDTAYFPSYVKTVPLGRDAARRLIGSSLGVAATIGAPLVAGVVVTARPLLTLLFGAEYANGAAALQLLALAVGMVFLHWSAGQFFLVEHRLRLYAAINGTAATLNILLNLWLIPRLGILGAATATFVCEMVTAVLGGIALWQLGVLPSGVTLVRPILAACAMGVAVSTLTGGATLVAQIGFGAIVYVGLVALSGGLPRGLLTGRNQQV